MRIVEQQHGAVTVIRPEGPIIQADAATLTQQAQQAATRSLGRLVLDLGAVAFVDSAGLESLLDLSDQLSATGQALKLCGTNRTVREVLDLTDLASRFEHFDDVTAAVRSFL